MKTVEVPLWTTAHERTALALERIATALEKMVAPVVITGTAAALGGHGLTPEEVHDILKSVGDETP